MNACALLPPEEGNRVLILTQAHRAALLRAQVPGALVLTQADSLTGLQPGFDAALVDGLLEHEPWDRWTLQRIHRLLRIDASITVVVPPLLSFASAGDLRFLAYAARKALERLVQRNDPQFRLPGAVHRRYHVPGLARTMESLGYASIEVLAREGGSALVARKASSLCGVQGRAWPDAKAHRTRFAERFASLVAARAAWLASAQSIRTVGPRALDPGEWRDARVLVLAPHPDDELIGCGGTLCRLLSAGAEVEILCATDGRSLRSLRDLPAADRKSVRLQEARRVAAALGVRLVLWRQEDGRLLCSSETIGKLARRLDELGATHVFTPFLGDPHADHGTLSRILAAALHATRVQPQVLQYEVWSLVPANLYCDVTDQAERLESLLLLYERAMRADDLVHFCETRNLARALELAGGPAYVEAFFATTSAEYRDLAGPTPPEGGP
jgi:LmbE family N-acetylglucosaminyl deacetylase